MRFSLSAYVAMVLTTTASGDPITFTHTGTASGSLDNVAFGSSVFTITAIGDTNERIESQFNSGWYIHHNAAQIEIDGLGTYTFTSPTRTFVNTNSMIVGFSRAGRMAFDLFNGPENAMFAAWDMTTSIGPSTGTGHTLQWSILSAPHISTNAGVLRLSDNSTPATFNAVVIPAPATTTVPMVGALVMSRRRRFAVSA